VWLGLLSLFFVVWLVVLSVPSLADEISIAEGRFVVWVADQRGAFESFFERTYDVAYTWLTPVVGWITVGALVFFRRVRHVLVYLAALVLSVAIADIFADLIERPRPYEVVLLGRWEGFSHPAWTTAIFAAVLFATVRSLVPVGDLRRWLSVAAGALVLFLALDEIYLGISHPTDVLVGGAIGLSVTFVLMYLVVPDEAFPVTYRRAGNAAHLDVSGARGKAIKTAIEDQLGLEIIQVKPVGLEGSAGSTPLKLTIAPDQAGGGDEPAALFAKLYAKTHLRSDRWYKFGRTLMYGRLEDETKFTTVSRLVEYEDYLGLKMAHAGIRVPKSHGIVEITPGREYVLVTDFLEGFVEIGEAEVDERVIDNGLHIVRQLWDGGLAHRDVKPSNVMTRGPEVALIDVAFSQVRPSPWRQAIDLANMMLVLALRSDAATVYERAKLEFSEGEIAEAFAASKSVTLPSQVRQEMKADGRDLLGEFRSLAPARPLVRLQRWSVRRIGALLLTAAVAVGAVLLSLGYLQLVGMLP